MTLAVPRRSLAILMFFQLGGALAQVSTSVAIVSDYRARGVSLSDGKPTPQLSIGYDHPDGWYLGGFASRVTLRGIDDSNQLITYAGYAHLLAPGLSWEAGASKSIIQRGSGFDYAETFIGLASDQLSGRLSYAPHYLGKKDGSLYAELNGNYPLSDRLRLTAHVGLLRSPSPPQSATPTQLYRADLRLGINFDIEAWKLQLAWLSTQKKHPAYAYRDGGSPQTWTASAGYEF
ncbi:TorF family putative porin [Janthinobacterium agaricidamnosum]|uniref:Lipoprotein n=1 Tax=Janthinobacterium agaricidamnosum NBRC 102515 = DSM 9628 TaxID=1349767 RepID=W0V4S1_9BURK|nr:TorF family putative porin [Janthinobacterium agaricidamnosum]CDG82871.1 conserved hypothetical protein [Janthinobacterium agaricidamnosum NBRC 102515 = DSM 9628]